MQHLLPVKGAGARVPSVETPKSQPGMCFFLNVFFFGGFGDFVAVFNLKCFPSKASFLQSPVSMKPRSGLQWLCSSSCNSRKS